MIVESSMRITFEKYVRTNVSRYNHNHTHRHTVIHGNRDAVYEERHRSTIKPNEGNRRRRATKKQPSQQQIASQSVTSTGTVESMYGCETRSGQPQEGVDMLRACGSHLI